MTITHDGAAGRMTGAEHYREAERLALAARATDGRPILDSQAADYAAVAQVHATLAMAWMPPTPGTADPRGLPYIARDDEAAEVGR